MILKREEAYLKEVKLAQEEELKIRDEYYE